MYNRYHIVEKQFNLYLGILLIVMNCVKISVKILVNLYMQV